MRLIDRGLISGLINGEVIRHTEVDTLWIVQGSEIAEISFELPELLIKRVAREAGLIGFDLGTEETFDKAFF